MGEPERRVLALRFSFRNGDGSISELPMILDGNDGKHRPLDRRKTWMDIRKGNQIVLWYPGREPVVRRIDRVELWMAHPPVDGMPEIVSGQEWVETGAVVGEKT